MRDGYMNIFTVRLKIHFANPKRDFPRQNVRDKHLLNRYVKHLKIEFALRTQRLGRVITPISFGPRDTLSLSLSLSREKGVEGRCSWQDWDRGSIFQPGIISHWAWNRTITRVTRPRPIDNYRRINPTPLPSPLPPPCRPIASVKRSVKNDHGDCCKPAGLVCQHVNWIIKYSEVIHAIHCARSFCRDDPLERGMHTGNANTRYPGRSAIEMSIALARD